MQRLEQVRTDTAPVAGELSDTPFAELIALHAEAATSGTLRVLDEQGTELASLWLEDGVVLAARVPDPETRLMQSVIPLCARKQGRFVLAPKLDDLERLTDVVRGKLDVLAFLAGAMRGPVREDAVDALFGRLGVALLKLHPRAPLARFAFTAHELVVVQVLEQNGPMTAAELLAHCPGAPHVARRVLYALAVGKALALMPPSARQVSGTVVHAAPLPPPRRSLPPRAEKKTVIMAAVTAPVGEPSAAPQRDSQSSLRIPASVRALRKPVLPRGIDPDEPARGGYHVRAGTEERISGAPSRRPEQRVARALELWRSEARERAQRAPQQSYYEVLGLAQDCATADVEQAYATLSKRFDPAELPAEIADAMDDAASVIEHARQAFEVLSDDTTRADYDRALENGLGVRPAVRKGMLAEACYRRAESLLKRRDYAGATCEVERALSQGGSCARYEALFGFLQHLRGGAGAGGRAHPLAIEHLDLALKQDPRCEQAHYYMAIVQKQLGNKERAHEHFQRALKLNPQNLEAAREVRLHNLRARDRSPSGLMKRLFGK